ncbi:Glucan endo-1,3-beta-D-glucosidase-like protein [Drosera capensis]
MASFHCKDSRLSTIDDCRLVLQWEWLRLRHVRVPNVEHMHRIVQHTLNSKHPTSDSCGLRDQAAFSSGQKERIGTFFPINVEFRQDITFVPAVNLSLLHIIHRTVDAVHSALKSMGFQDIEILVAETGWPYRGDSNEVGPSIENAKAYNGGLISHLRSRVGTPLMPGKSVDTYIFALYDEDLKPGPASERSFGLYRPDMSMTYDVGLSKSTQAPSTAPSLTPATPSAPSTTPATPSAPSTTPATAPPSPPSGVWCVPKAGVPDAQLQANLDYACSHGIDCTPIQPGGACFNPNTVASHAAYAMNLYYQTAGRNPWNCDFVQTATVTSTNPSYNGCTYPGGSAGFLARETVNNNANINHGWRLSWCCFCGDLRGGTGKSSGEVWTHGSRLLSDIARPHGKGLFPGLNSRKEPDCERSVACGGLDSVCDGNLPVARTLSGHKGYVSCCRYVLDEDNHLITGSRDHTCILLDITAGLRTSVFRGEVQPGHTSDVLRMFVSGSCDATARLWDARAASRAVRTFYGHEGDVDAVKFFPDGYRFGTGSADGTHRLFDIRTGHQLQVYRHPDNGNDGPHVTSIAFSISGRLLFAGYTRMVTAMCGTHYWHRLDDTVALSIAGGAEFGISPEFTWGTNQLFGFVCRRKRPLHWKLGQKPEECLMEAAAQATMRIISWMLKLFSKRGSANPSKLPSSRVRFKRGLACYVRATHMNKWQGKGKTTRVRFIYL